MHNFTIIVSKQSDGRYQAIARTADGDRTAYGLTHLGAILAVLEAAWSASLIK